MPTKAISRVRTRNWGVAAEKFDFAAHDVANTLMKRQREKLRHEQRHLLTAGDDDDPVERQGVAFDSGHAIRSD